jgi:hypothetical protein
VNTIRRIAFALALGFFAVLRAAPPAPAADAPPDAKPDLISPADVRIRVKLDKPTLRQIRNTILREVRAARKERERRLRLSRRIVTRAVRRTINREPLPARAQSAVQPERADPLPATLRPADDGGATPRPNERTGPAPTHAATLDEIRDYVRGEVRAALDLRKRRLELSAAALGQAAERELARVNRHLRAVEQARSARDAAEQRGDAAAARTWAALADDRAKQVIDLARRLLANEAVLAAVADFDPHALTDEQRDAVADRALDALDDALDDAREPHGDSTNTGRGR